MDALKRIAKVSLGLFLPLLTCKRTIFVLLLFIITDCKPSAASLLPDNCPSMINNQTCQPQNFLCEERYWWCKCDDYCNIYGDCCPDFVPDNPVSLEYDMTLSCRKVKSVSGGNNIFIVDSCPSEYPGRRDLCEQGTISKGLLSSLPVHDKNGLLFQNVFCASCNNVMKNDMTFWKTEIVCTKHIVTEIKAAIQTGVCHVSHKPPDEGESGRTCHKIIDKCPQGYNNNCTKHQCDDSNFECHLRQGANIFKNEHCAECHGVSDASQSILPWERISRPSMAYSGAGEEDTYAYNYREYGNLISSEDIKYENDFYPMSIIIDLNTAEGGKVGYINEFGFIVETTSSCEEGFMFDLLENECIFVYCAEGLVQVGQMCVSLNDSVTDCPRRVLLVDEYDLLENGTVIDKSGYSYTTSEYDDFGNGTIAVCIIPKQYKVVLKFDKAQTIFSVVGQCISIICLIIHLIVYSILPQLRNPPGKSLMALVASLLAAQVLFLFGVGQTDPYELCVTIGVLIHYSFLASFFWMGVMSFDIWATFSESNITNTFSRKSKTFIRYCAVGFGGPFAIVAIAIILNFILAVPEFIRPGYGEGLCWIVHRNALLVFFGVPIFSIVFINIVFYCLTLRALYQTSKVTKPIQSDKSDQQRFSLYVKLSAIMGLTWIFGLVAVLADVPLLWYVFLFFNTLQGAFICITFVFTKKVIRLLKEKFGETLLSSAQPSDGDGSKTTNLSKGQSSASSKAGHEISKMDNM